MRGNVSGKNALWARERQKITRKIKTTDRPKCYIIHVNAPDYTFIIIILAVCSKRNTHTTYKYKLPFARSNREPFDTLLYVCVYVRERDTIYLHLCLSCTLFECVCACASVDVYSCFHQIVMNYWRLQWAHWDIYTNIRCLLLVTESTHERERE